MRVLRTSTGVYTISRPTVEDGMTVAEEMRASAAKRMPNVVTMVYDLCKELPVAWAKAFIDAAVASLRAGPVAPSEYLEQAEYATEEGLAFRLWYYVHKNHPEFTLHVAKQLIETEGRFAMAQALNDALQFPEEGKKNETETGTGLS